MPPGAEEGNSPPLIDINLYEKHAIIGKFKIFIQKTIEVVNQLKMSV